MISLSPNRKRFTDLYGNPVENETYFELNGDDEYLYATFTCYFKEKPKDMTAVYGNRVFRDECVEVFIGNRKKYYEIDASAYNVRFIALVDNPNNEIAPGVTETEIAGLEIHTEMSEGYYIARYKLPIDSLKGFGNEIYFNAFRVEMKDGKRVSRAFNATGSVAHHDVTAFERII